MILNNHRSTTSSTTSSTLDTPVDFQNHLPIPPTEFCVHPLIAIEHYIRERNVDNIPNFPRSVLYSFSYQPLGARNSVIDHSLTLIKDVDIPNYEDLRDHVMSAVSWFRTEYSLQRLSGIPTSDWQDKAMVALRDCDNKVLRWEDLKIVCKLVLFYDFEQEVLKLCDECDTLTDATKDRFIFSDLELLKTQVSSESSNKDKTAYFFRTQENHLLRVDLDYVMSNAVDIILKLNGKISLDILVCPRIIYNNNYTYYTTYNIHGIGA